MGLSLDAKMVSITASFRDQFLLTPEAEDRVAQDLVGKVFREITPQTGVQVIDRTHDVDCSGLPRILVNRGLVPVRFEHQVRLDDRDPTQKYHVMMIWLEKGDSSMDHPAIRWLARYTSSQAVKIRGYDNPYYQDERPTSDRCSSLNLDQLAYRCLLRNSKRTLVFTRANGLSVMPRR